VRLARFIAPLVVGALLALQPAFALSPESFTQELVSRLKAAVPDATVAIIKPLELRVTRGKDEPSTLYLDNVYRLSENDPDSRTELIDHYISVMVESARLPDVLDPKNIIAVVKDRAWVAEMSESARRAGGDGLTQVYDELNDELVVVYAEDSPQSIAYFSPDRLEKAGIKRADLRAIAIRNLRRILPKVELHQGELFSMVTAGEDYVPSLLLFDELWQKGHFKVDGDVVVAVPSRDVLLITGSRNAEGIAKVREVAQEIVEGGPYTLTSVLFVYRNGKFRRLAP